MPTTTRCLLLAAATAALGVALRAVVPVAPVDGPFRGVLRAYAVPASGPGNTGETSTP